MNLITRLFGTIVPLCFAATAMAQTPEGLPEGYSGRQFTDGSGCQYQLGSDGAWAPRLGRDGRPLCGYLPTAVGPAAAPAVEEGAADPYDALAQDESVQPPEAMGPTAPSDQPDSPPVTDTAEALAMDPSIGPPDDTAALSSPPQILPTLQGPPELAAAPLQETMPRAAAQAEPPAVATTQRRATGHRTGHSARTKRVATKPATSRHRQKAAPSSAGHRYVQVGAFAQPENARRAERRLLAMGLPVSRGKSQVHGQWLEVIMAGPFDDRATLRATRRSLRRNGYPTAFTR